MIEYMKVMSIMKNYNCREYKKEYKAKIGAEDEEGL
jgi:hypothetical protein